MWIYKGTNKIHSTAIIGDNVHLGENNIIYPYAVLGLVGFIRGHGEVAGTIVIGDNNWIGCHTSFMCGEEGETRVGNNNLIMNYVNIGHHVQVGDHNEIGARSLLAGYSSIGDYNKIKVNCTLRNRITVGSHNIIGMGSNVVANIGSKSLCFGNPCKKIRDL